MANNSWQFWIDRGGTFTDIVAKAPDGQIIIHKLLSENPDRYEDAPVQGIREILGIPQDQPISSEEIEVIKMGTTVATNALLERKGDRTVLVITKGFKDALRVGYQNRPNIFAREIILPEMLYEKVIEVEERYTAKGEEIISLQTTELTIQLQEVYAAGIRSCAIVLMHGYRYPKHEQKIKEIAQEIGFTQISVSHEVSPLMKLVSRGDTTVVDAYLSPILLRYVNQVSNSLNCFENLETEDISSLRNSSEPSFERKEIGGGVGGGEENKTDLTLTFGKVNSSNISERQPVKLMFMQSNGGLTDAQKFQGKDSILSGPAGGIVGAVQTSKMAGFHKIISFDMGGTSTDVAHYAGAENKTIEYEREFETEIAGVRLQTPMMSIHTVAAGGGSILFFDGSRYRVGPESAGANPGPAAYGKGGPLTVTDCNVMVGKIQPEFFPKVFGKDGNLPLNLEIVREKFTQLAAEIGNSKKPEEVASGYLAIAVEKMANAIKKISLEKGYDVSEYTLCCFGGAGGQHACLIADALGMKQIFIHPYAGVLSAYGMGLADIRVMKEKAVEKILTLELLPEIKQILATLETEAKQEVNSNQNQISLSKIHIKYQGSDSTLIIDFAENISIMKSEFETAHQQRYGFIMAEKSLIIEAVSLELIQQMETPEETEKYPTQKTAITPITTTKIYTSGKWQDTPIYLRENLQPGTKINSPALIIEKTGTNIIEPGWQAELTLKNHLVLTKIKTTEKSLDPTTKSQTKIPTSADPVMLEIFNNLFRAIAEQMGITLQKTGSSVNIKERLDFSCAIFDRDGQLVANAPHIPIHLGSMSESVNAVISDKKDILKPGDVYVLNNPYNGGTHLPDITVITPVFPPLEKPKVPSVIANHDLQNKNNNTFPESLPSEETLSDTKIALDDKSITQKLKSVQLCGNEKLIWENQTNTFPETNTSEETLSDTKIALDDKSITQKLKSVQLSGNETLSDTKITLGDKSITQKLKSVQLPDNKNLIWENQTNIFPEINTSEETLSNTNIALGDKSTTQKLKSVQLPGNEKLIWQNQANIFPEINTSEETLSNTKIALDDKSITQKLKSVQFPGEETLSDTKITLGDKSIIQKLKSVQLPDNKNLIWENQTNIFPEINTSEETLSNTNIALGDKSTTQKLKSVQLPGNEKLIWQNQANIFPEINTSEETLSNTKIALDDKSITQKLKSVQFPGEETLSDTKITLGDKSIIQKLKSVQLPDNKNLIWENQTNIFPETNTSEETLSNTNIALGDKSITQKLKSVQLPGNEKLMWENQTNIFPEINTSEETLSNTNIGLDDKSITQKLKSVQLPGNEKLMWENQTNIFPEINTSEETLSNTNIGLDDKSITQKLKSVQLPSEETLSNTNIGLDDKSITQKLKSVQLPGNEKLIWQNQTNTFPETNSTEETLSNTNIGLDDKSITQKLKSVNPPANENIISENETTTSLTHPEKTEKRETPIFYVASRGHHADIGGITPGSMPPHSKTVEEEGILIDNFQLVKNGKFQETEILNILTSGKYPARNTSQNIADLQAQIAANEKGTQELQKMTEKYGLETVQTYMKFVQDNAETSVRRAIKKLSSSLKKQISTSTFDDSNKIQVSVSLDQKNLSAKIDFTGTSPQLPTNFNAPTAVCKAAVLYVFRTLVDDDIPLNAGCLKPLEIIIPEGSMLDPKYPAAIVAGNVETSQTIADTLYNALGIMASSQGTMNNFTFGNSKYQYYETICGGSGAGINFHGTDAVHTHMTNSRLTDPEVLEWRFPVLLENFAIRSGSGGEGLYKGGNGVIRKIRFLEQMTAGILSGHRVVSPPGLNGGGDGLVGRNYVERSDGKIEELGSTATVEMNAGDVFVIETPGGGGVGKS
ncbi:hydantoinase B/oxoprolinase family protein [Okeania sp. SIO2C9]|uniref:hydantoinase B/oxoprolinase family protein n=1 Tax=Okeania sp. SIO2C9 TaxID=2607791 RepID=UPI0025DC2C62|nr:hydantoinase B/oxoprolinase family protein [Okeania sp. SIO2C9]